jgi:hypothetical protein
VCVCVFVFVHACTYARVEGPRRLGIQHQPCVLSDSLGQMERALPLCHGHDEPCAAHVNAAVRGQFDVILARHDTRKLLVGLGHVLAHHSQPGRIMGQCAISVRG